MAALNEEDFKTVEMMKRYGGSFVKALAEACYHADKDNLALIKSTWPIYWEQYRRMGINDED